MIFELIDVNVLKNVIPIFVFSFLIGYIADSILAYLSIESKSKASFRGFRIHHNLLGYVLIITGAFYYHSILIGFGLGIILGHRLRDGILLFFERVEIEVERDKKIIEGRIKRLRAENKRKLEKKIREIRQEYKQI